MIANTFGGKKNSIVPSEHEATQIDQSVSETLIQNDDETSPPPEKQVKVGNDIAACTLNSQLKWTTFARQCHDEETCEVLRAEAETW